jgi:lysozyme
MNPSVNAYNLAKEAEGLRLAAYPDPGSGGDPWTIGYGSTRGVKKGMTITAGEANARLAVDMAEAGNAVTRWVDKPLNQNQFDALCDFVFNLGEGNFRGSTLLKKLNAGDYAGAAAEFGKWVKASGRTLPGLVTRRAAERALFERAV